MVVPPPASADEANPFEQALLRRPNLQGTDDLLVAQVGGTILAAKLVKERAWAVNVGGPVYILDMFNPEIYPHDYEARGYINQKVEVPSGTRTNTYLSKLDEALEVASCAYDPELLVYNAGMDILDGDPLGRLTISPDGIVSRDEKVFKYARERNIPIVMLTSDSIINLSKKHLIQKGLPSSKV